MSKNRGYVFSYQAKASLYEKLDVKSKIVEILILEGAKNLNSSTDSTIYFENLILESENAIAKWRDILQRKFYLEELTKGIHYTLALCSLNESEKPTFWDKYQDTKLSDRFRIMVQELRTKLGKPE